uniref:Uncharacterized protein n=1 Tax=Magnetospirillum gryphiswaldense TaxID=55518 RepID=A4TYM0_9PROT|nr:hypothetical protein MGR_0501 [Magnetospirillum gryphiswaldense MSR-1]
MGSFRVVCLPPFFFSFGWRIVPQGPCQLHRVGNAALRGRV